MLTAGRLRDLIYYEPSSGALWWRETGRIAETGYSGYLFVRVDGVRYAAHRLAWLYVYGDWPKGQIDHANRDGRDNRVENLRDATVSQNQANAARRRDNTTGFKGVDWRKDARLWRARVKTNGHRIHLGYFETAEEAHSAYVRAAGALHGEFARSA